MHNFFQFYKESFRTWQHGLAAKVLALNTWNPIMVPVLILAAPHPIQLYACGLGKQWRTAQALGSCTHVGYLEEVLGSWLRIGIASAIALIWGVIHQKEDLPLSLLLSVYLTYQ